MQRNFCLIEGSIQGTITFKWDPMAFEVYADSITLENEYGTVTLDGRHRDFERNLHSLIEDQCLKDFADDPDMIEFWRRAEISEYRGHRRHA